MELSKDNRMRLPSGTRVGPYEITGNLGAGGMGEVFAARDTRLERNVAIKILPAELAHSAQFKLRFEREAKTISQLNHPHICTLYDVGESSAVEGEAPFSYLVMELIEGESLAERLARAPLPLNELLRYGIEIAEALDKAHRQGVIHRDLKPANIMLTKSGAKLLDFGLAKSTTIEVGEDDQTRQKEITAEGTIVGTFQYMSPEQLEGKEAGPRTDIFALGCVLYEMATGQRAFQGKTKTSLIAAIVGGHPRPITEFQPLTPPALTHVITRCLEKDPEDRWQSARDVAEELKWINTAGSQAGVAAPVTMRRKTRERLAWTLVPVVALAVFAATWFGAKAFRPRPQVVESSIAFPDNLRLADGDNGQMLSPDGLSIVAALMDQEGNRSLWVRSLSGTAIRNIPGTADASGPFWSPDSRRIGFFASGKLKIVDASGGVVQSIADVTEARGGSWSQRGMIVYAPGISTPIMKIPSGGGTPVAVTDLGKSRTHRYPWFLPDGEDFLFFSDTAGICVASVDHPKQVRTLLKSDYAGIYASGNILFWRDGSVMAQPFDAKHLVVSGDAVPITGGVAQFRSTGVFSASTDGTLLFQPGANLLNTQLAWVDRSGKDIGTVAPKGEYYSPRLSHDQRRIAVDRSETGQGDIWVFDLVRNVSSRLTFDPANESSPVWSVDDKEIFFFRDDQGGSNIYQVPAGGTGNAEMFIQSSYRKGPTDTSREWVLINSGGNGGIDIAIASLRDKTIRPLLSTPFREMNGALSPDGAWIAYESDETGRPEVYVRSFPQSEEKLLISNDGGSTPSWRGDGREIYYVSRDQKLMAVPVTYAPSFDAGTPAALFNVSLRNVPNARQYDVSSDGKRFLLNRITEHTSMEPVRLVQNWTERLRKQ